MPGPNAIAFLQDIVLPLSVAAGLVFASLMIASAMLALTRSAMEATLELAIPAFASLMAATWLLARAASPMVAGAILVVIVGLALVPAWRGRRRHGAPHTRRPMSMVAGTVALTLLASLVPFLASGRFGVPGVGMNDDSAAHMFWILHAADRGELPSSVAGGGYPTGPHLVVASIIELLPGAPVEAVFVGFMLAVQALLAVASLAVLRDLWVVPRMLLAAFVPMAYLNAAYFAQSAYKEPLTAMLVVGLAVLVGRLLSKDSGIAGSVAALAAASTVAGLYLSVGLTGLAWPVALAGVALLVVLVRRGRALLRSRRFLATVGSLVGLLAVLGVAFRETITVQLTTLRNLPVEGGIVPTHLPFVEVFGIWRSADFRTVPTDPIAGVAAAGAAALVFAWALVWWCRRGELAVPAATIVTLGLYAVTRPDQGPYWVAKLLAIASPLVALVIVRALVADARAHGVRSFGGGGRLLVATVYVGLASLSTVTLLMAAPVSSLDRTDELAPIRRAIGNEPVLYLGQDYFIDTKLRSSRVSHLFPYSKENHIPVVTTDGQWPVLGELVDWDTVTADSLDQFRYVVTTAGAYASSAPTNWTSVERTSSYELFRRSGETIPRRADDEPGSFGWELSCPPSPASYDALHTREAPVSLPAPRWRLSDGSVAPRVETTMLLPSLQPMRQRVELEAGTWDLVMQYQSSVRLRVKVDGQLFILPAEPDTLGQRWPVGRFDVSGRSPVLIEVEAEAPALGPHRQALVGAVAAVQVGGSTVNDSATCGAFVDWMRGAPGRARTAPDV